jgi:hypothetical protein
MLHRVRQVLWLLYALLFLVIAYAAFRDDLTLRYPLYFTIPAAVSNVIVTCGVVAYAVVFRAAGLKRGYRRLFPVLLAFPVVGLVMDAFLPADWNLKTGGVIWVLKVMVIVVLVAPAYFAIWRLGRDGS